VARHANEQRPRGNPKTLKEGEAKNREPSPYDVISGASDFRGKKRRKTKPPNGGECYEQAWRKKKEAKSIGGGMQSVGERTWKSLKGNLTRGLIEKIEV